MALHPLKLLLTTTLPLILLFFLTPCYSQVNSTEDEVTRYVHIVQNGIQNALNYIRKANAHEYQTNPKLCPPNNCSTIDFGTYDFIIIGSGASGSVVANRLTENPEFEVLLIDAGHYEDEFITIPGLKSYAGGTDYAWGFQTTPQYTSCQGQFDGRCAQFRGRGIGGSTIVNTLIYSRAAKSDYNRWGEDNPGWSFEEILPYFIKSENSHINSSHEDYHGTEGYLNVEYSYYTTPHIEAFLEANLALGYKQIDYNGPNQMGFSRPQYNTLNGRRHSVGAAYILPFLNRTNLNISVDSYVTKINIDFVSRVARGVTFMKNNIPHVAHCKKEIILSAGALSSPQILMQSGIGPRTHLRELGIPVLANLPVGNNLQNHYTSYGLSITTNTSIELNTVEHNIREYLQGRGVYTMPGNRGALGYYKTNFSKYPEDTPDLEFIFIAPNRTAGFYQAGYTFLPQTFQALVKDLNDSFTFTVLIVAQHPDSVGTVRLENSNPFNFPVVNPKLMDDPEQYDLETLFAGRVLLEQILNTTAMRKLNAQFKPILLPNCREHEMFSAEYWRCFILQTSNDIFHPVGTCKMGSDPTKGAVVDNKLRVYGVQGLRIADAGVIPFSISGHPVATCVMIGERLADFLKEEYNSEGINIGKFDVIEILQSLFKLW